MPLNRTEALLALTNLLENKISTSKVYEWALAYAVSKDFEAITNDDPLLREIVQVLMDMNQQGEYTPSDADFLYYKKCLEGEADYEPLAIRREKVKKARRDAADMIKVQQKEILIASPKTLSRKIMRVYVFLFALTSLAVNVAGIVKPGLFRPDEVIARGQALKEALPHFIYVAILLTPSATLVNGFNGVLYYLGLPTLFLGTIFYFYITVSIVLQLKLNALMILAFAPFALVPALFSLWLLLTEKKV